VKLSQPPPGQLHPAAAVAIVHLDRSLASPSCVDKCKENVKLSSSASYRFAPSGLRSSRPSPKMTLASSSNHVRRESDRDMP